MDQKDKGEMVLEVLTIFAAQSPEHQMRIFEPAQPNSRRVSPLSSAAENCLLFDNRIQLIYKTFEPLK